MFLNSVAMSSASPIAVSFTASAAFLVIFSLYASPWVSPDGTPMVVPTTRTNPSVFPSTPLNVVPVVNASEENPLTPDILSI